METKENPDEGFETSSAKVVTGVRTQPELKMQLTEEGGDCGMSTSEYCEMLLLNRHKDKAEIEQLRELVGVLQKGKEKQQTQEAAREKQLEVALAENERLRELVAVLQKGNEKRQTQAATGVKQAEAEAEIVQLRKQLEEQNNQLAIYSDQRLIYLYENVKGKKDIVENAYGDNFEITYDTPVQVLLALIYSSKINT